MKQTKTVITITHTGGDDLDIKVNFLPSAKTTGPLSPAHAFGAEFLQFIKERNTVKSEKLSVGGVEIAGQ